MCGILQFFLSSTLVLAADYGITAKEIMMSWGAILVAAESKRGRRGGKTGIYVRKEVLNYDAIMATENIYKLLTFHCPD